MENDNDWYNVLDSVLFTCCIATHSSTGVSPYHMVYNKDPILPFEYKDKLDFHSDEYLDYKSALTAPNVCTQANGTNINLEFSQTLKAMEKQKQEIFSHVLKPKLKKHRSTRPNVTMLEMQVFHLRSELKFLRKI